MPESQSQAVALAVRAATEWMEVELTCYAPLSSLPRYILQFVAAGGDGTAVSRRPHFQSDAGGRNGALRVSFIVSRCDRADYLFSLAE